MTPISKKILFEKTYKIGSEMHGFVLSASTGTT